MIKPLSKTPGPEQPARRFLVKLSRFRRQTLLGNQAEGRSEHRVVRPPLAMPHSGKKTALQLQRRHGLSGQGIVRQLRSQNEIERMDMSRSQNEPLQVRRQGVDHFPYEILLHPLHGRVADTRVTQGEKRVTTELLECRYEEQNTNRPAFRF